MAGPTSLVPNRSLVGPTAPARQASVPQSVTVVDKQFGYSKDSGFNAQTSGTGPGGIQYNANVSGPSLKVDGRAKANVGVKGIDVQVSVDVNATLAQGGAKATKTFTVDVAGEKLDITVDLSAKGLIGADGKLNLNIHIGTDGRASLSANASGFAGARASLTGGVSVKHQGREIAGGDLTLSATAGVSARAHADVELKGGKIHFDVGAEATAGAGFGVDVEGDLDPKNSARFLAEVLGGLAGQGVGWAKDKLGDVTNWAGDRFEDVGGWIGKHVPKLDWPF